MLGGSSSEEEEEDGIIQELETELFSDAMLQASILELATWDTSASASASNGITPASQPAQPAQADFMSLDGASDQDPTARIRRLERQVEHLKSMQRESGKTIERLAQEVVMAKKDTTSRGRRRNNDSDNDNDDVDDDDDVDVDMNGGD